MSLTYPEPRLLSANDDLASFECRSARQSEWLRRIAHLAHSAYTARVYVITEPDISTVVAFYAWCMASIRSEAAPARMLKGAGHYDQHPVALLTRLGVDRGHEGQALGTGLLQDVIARATDIGTQIGCRGLLVHAESDAARAFYIHQIPNFMPSPTDPMHLVLMMKDLRRLRA